MKKEKKGGLLLGALVLLAVVAIVALVGILALRPEKTIAHGYGGAERNGKVGDLTGVRQIWYNFKHHAGDCLQRRKGVRS